MSPFRAARSSNWIARFLSAAEEAVPLAFFRAVRSAARWARLRIAAALDFRRFLAADAILGKENAPNKRKIGVDYEPRSIGAPESEVKQVY